MPEPLAELSMCVELERTARATRKRSRAPRASAGRRARAPAL